MDCFVEHIYKFASFFEHKTSVSSRDIDLKIVIYGSTKQLTSTRTKWQWFLIADSREEPCSTRVTAPFP